MAVGLAVSDQAEVSDATSWSGDANAATGRAVTERCLDGNAQHDPERGVSVDAGASWGAEDAQTIAYGGDLRSAELAEEEDVFEIRVGDVARRQLVGHSRLRGDVAIARAWLLREPGGDRSMPGEQAAQSCLARCRWRCTGDRWSRAVQRAKLAGAGSSCVRGRCDTCWPGCPRVRSSRSGDRRGQAGSWIERQRGQLKEPFDLVWARDARIAAVCGVGFDQRERAVRLAQCAVVRGA